MVPSGALLALLLRCSAVLLLALPLLWQVVLVRMLELLCYETEVLFVTSWQLQLLLCQLLLQLMGPLSCSSCLWGHCRGNCSHRANAGS